MFGFRWLPLLLVLGCSSSAATNDADDDSTATGGTSGSGGSGGSSERPYANVVSVATSGEPGAYTFAVTVESADIDCSQYADWWEVLASDGALVYRRILEHSHTDENGTTDADAPGNTFTRLGGPVNVAEGDALVVRAHMSVGGYHGSVLRGSPAGGFVDAPNIDENFAPEVESEEPLPTSCDF